MTSWGKYPVVCPWCRRTYERDRPLGSMEVASPCGDCLERAGEARKEKS